MTRRLARSSTPGLAMAAMLLVLAVPGRPVAQGRPSAPAQTVDEEYTAKIKEYTRDPRIITELVDHLPASGTLPTPLEFFGRLPGTPDELTYAKDIHRYYEALDKASDRIAMWKIGVSEEGRDMVLLAVADEATIRNLDKFKRMAASLTDPRKTSEQAARQLIREAKPIYWITSGMHSPENGGPEMLIELPYRLAAGESPLIQSIRRNVITLITPVIEVDGREKQVDTYYFNKGRPESEPRLPLMYWGKYVAHDNNRDGMGQFLALTRNVTKTFLEWKPTILHDLHEQSTYLYASTGTGPYNEQIDPITIDEWWLLAKTEVMEMTKRGVPGVWTYGFYDGWTPNYMFFIAHSHNAVGRFYEVMGYGPQKRTVNAQPTLTSREWFRPNPPLPSIEWGPRNTVNIQQSALLIALDHVAKNRELYLENYWLKNKRAVEKGTNGPTFAWIIPASQRRKAETVAAINELRRQGLEVHRVDAAFKAGVEAVKAGDYVVRGDQPYRTLADMYFAIQNFSPANPRPYDDTGWTFQFLRNIVIKPVTDKTVLAQPMTLLTSDAKAPGGIEGSGPVVLVDHTTDNNLVTFRFKHHAVRMQAAEEAFDAAGRKFRAGTFIIPNADRAALDATLRELGLSAWAVASPPSVPVHDLDVPRIGYIHSWANTQNEGWVRAAFDHFGVPYTYFGDVKVREGNLRSKYDVIVYPHVGGNAQSQVNGIPRTGAALPYRKTEKTPNLGAQDEADDIRGGMGLEGLMELVKFVQQGGTLIVEGATSTIFPEYKVTTGIAVESPGQLLVRGSVMRGVVADRRSPIAYGYDAQLPVYFNQEPVLNVVPVVAGFGGGRGGEGIPGVGMNITPVASTSQRLSTWDPDATDVLPSASPSRALAEDSGRAAGAATGRAGGPDRAGVDDPATRPRVVLQFPANPDDMLLSGVLVGGQALSGRAQVIDVPLGEGHLVMFAIRPFWRWQTQGTFFLGFNAILNWNDLSAGRAEEGGQPPF